MQYNFDAKLCCRDARTNVAAVATKGEKGLKKKGSNQSPYSVTFIGFKYNLNIFGARRQAPSSIVANALQL